MMFSTPSFIVYKNKSNSDTIKYNYMKSFKGKFQIKANFFPYFTYQFIQTWFRNLEFFLWNHFKSSKDNFFEKNQTLNGNRKRFLILISVKIGQRELILGKKLVYVPCFYFLQSLQTDKKEILQKDYFPNHQRCIGPFQKKKTVTRYCHDWSFT